MNIDRLEAWIEQGKGPWLVALFGEDGETDPAWAPPEGTMPEWFARFISWMDAYSSTGERWFEFGRRLANALRSRCPEHEWQRLDYAVRATLLREAMAHTADRAVTAACILGVDLCERAAHGAMPSSAEFSTASEQARSAYEAPTVSGSSAYAAAATLEAVGYPYPAKYDLIEKIADAVNGAAVASEENQPAAREHCDRMIDRALKLLERSSGENDVR